MERWYVAKTKPCRERVVEIRLTREQGVEVFLPLISRPPGGKTGWEPLFPTYLFCLVDPQTADWPAIRWTPGLSYFLGSSEGLVPVSDELVTHIKQRVSWWNDGGFRPRFTPGDRVAVTSGPFAGLEGIFQEYVPARQRCQVLLHVLGRLTKVQLPAEVLVGGSPYSGLALAAGNSPAMG
jgi:transcriptional antiterminator RfaH